MARTERLPRRPEQMPVHFGADGEADRFTDKSLQSFLFTILLGPVITLLVMLGAQGLISAQSSHITELGSPIRDANTIYRAWEGLRAAMHYIGWYTGGLAITLAAGVGFNLHPRIDDLLPLTLLTIGALTLALIVTISRLSKKLEEK
ncbi:DUF1648 domain-containing protein [Corynebacterium yudongzhengii]|uniref:DUF1648 domain-containing protein n=1 Tax=Corynebacterium yudongzhengii TaxID=2080740 RepID=UPI00131EE7FD|nr:DUF1648 domain-containing protein [Corynebacterium yudongzhengii]